MHLYIIAVACEVLTLQKSKKDVTDNADSYIRQEVDVGRQKISNLAYRYLLLFTPQGAD